MGEILNTEDQLVEVLRGTPGLQLWLSDGELRYRAPKGVVTRDVLEVIKTHKSVIVDILKRRSSFLAGHPETPDYRSLETPAAIRMPFHHRLWKNRALFGVEYTNGTMVMRVVPTGIELTAVCQLIGELQKRHDVLRGRFKEVSDAPVLSVVPTFRVPVYLRGFTPGSLKHSSRCDFRPSSDGGEGETLVEWASREAWRPLDLSNEPWRIVIAPIDESKHLLGFVFHHFICDFYALDMIAAEIEKIYTAITGGGNLSDIPETLQYNDYVTGLKEWMVTPNGLRAERYWAERLKDLPGTGLPPDEGICDSVAGNDRLVFGLPGEKVTKITETCASVNCTFVTALLAAQFAALRHFTNSNDLTIWNFREGRLDRRLMGVLGMIVDEVPYRVNLPAGKSMLEALTIVRDVMLEAEEHQPYPSSVVRDMLEEAGENLRAPTLNFVPQASPGDEDGSSADGQEKWAEFVIDRPPEGALTRIRRIHTMPYLVRASTQRGELRGQLVYAAHSYKKETMEHFLACVGDNLLALA